MGYRPHPLLRRIAQSRRARRIYVRYIAFRCNLTSERKAILHKRLATGMANSQRARRYGSYKKEF